MFQTSRVGRRIVALRKEHNMTQSELADRMGVSFQAVSNWERGNSMPDISKLPELAGIFGVTVDELLGEEAPLLRSAMEEKLGEYVQANPVSREELEASIPLLKPDQVDTIAKHIDLEACGGVDAFLPFLDQETLGELAWRRAREGKNVAEFLPFLEEDALEELAVYRTEQGKSVSAFLPFLSGKALERLALLKEERGEGISDFYPFLSKRALKRLAADRLAEGKSIKKMLPFLDGGFLRQMVLGEEKE